MKVFCIFAHLQTHSIYMLRCIELAKLGGGAVAPNPLVGAVLVHNNRIIGEGYHMQYGQAHAEVNCINSIAEEDRELVEKSIIFVSLEPCAHHGKTPPCADLIIAKKIPTVVIGCRDPFIEVGGKGIEKLQAAGVEVIQHVSEDDCKNLNKRFLTFHTQHRPYIILKWAQTVNGIIGNEDHSRLLISNEFTNRLVHKWRSEEASILVGTNTALFDDPSLATRLWKGNNSVRLVLDMDLRLPASLRLFDGSIRTIVFNSLKHEACGNLLYYPFTKDVSIVHQVCNALYQLNIQSVLIEGGTQLLQSFIDEKMYDEIRIITNHHLESAGGIPAPVARDTELQSSMQLQSDTIRFYKPVS
ncbi:MAG: bifunctional diaminohydroxyphosphoribosylaminopyrimidine deaminase/5-amino-6-(5-phosphoribosylamino)uracil reductase RibD [Bacteroidota bacterium]